MKALFATAAVAMTTLAATPASAGIVSMGNSLARDCYEAAVARDFDRNAFNHCDLALSEEGLSDRDRAATHVNRGVLHLRNRAYDSATRDFDSALKLDSTNAEAWLNMAIEKLRNGGGADALPMIDRSLALHTGQQALAYYSRSIAYERMGRLRAAYDDLKRATELDPKWSAPAEDLKRFVVR